MTQREKTEYLTEGGRIILILRSRHLLHEVIGHACVSIQIIFGATLQHI